MSQPRVVPNVTSRLSKSLLAMDVSRSPKESPPTIKKKLCRLVNGALNGNTDIAYFQSEKTRKQSSPITIKRSNSILKKSTSRGSPDSTGSLSPGSQRRVQFRQQVTVFLMTDEGDIVCSDSQKLSNCVENQRPIPRCIRSSSTFANGYEFSKDRTDIKVSDDVVDPSEVDFSLVEDPTKGTILKFTVNLTNDYKPDDIVVKANVSGSRIRLVANRPVSYPDGSMRMEQVSRRFMLPTEVDPYTVTARLDIKGQLTVEAPVLTIAKRENNKRTSVALSDISNKAQSNV